MLLFITAICIAKLWLMPLLKYLKKAAFSKLSPLVILLTQKQWLPSIYSAHSWKDAAVKTREHFIQSLRVNRELIAREYLNVLVIHRRHLLVAHLKAPWH